MRRYLLIAWMVAPVIGSLVFVHPAALLGQASSRASMLEGMAPSPASITEPVLLEAWRYLYDQNEPFQLWAGSSFSGRMLAQFILDHQILVVWDWANICGGDSCSPQYCIRNSCIDCIKDICIDKAGNPATITIYVSLSEYDIPNVAGTLAHEAFHQLHPFGNVPDTRYEEYLAYAAGKHISHSTWPSFEGIDPLIPAQLIHWFNANGIHGYYSLQLYPAGLAGVAPRGAEDAIRSLMKP